MFEQLDLFEESEHPFKITKPIRLIEFFAGVGFQRMGIERTFPNATSWRTTEWAVPSILAYDVAHNGNVATSTIEDKDFLVNELFNLGISVNYNDPASLSQIQHMPLEKLQRIYAAIERNNNLVNIMNVKGIDLNLVDYEDYTYVLTYSFPCQDLSLAGSGNGYETSQAENENQQLDSGVGTRSGLVWEVIRILKECKELGTLPHILVMENVTQVHGLGNVKEWHKLLNELSSLGYANFWKDMNGKNYGIPQNRDRTFMISILDKDAVYHFPKKVKLKLCLGDLLEKNVDEKYFLSKKMLDYLLSDGTGNYPRRERFLANIGRKNTNVGTSVTTLAGNRATDNFIIEKYGNKALDETLEQNKVENGDFIDAYNSRMESHRGTVQKGISQTLTTQAGKDTGVCVKDETMFTETEKQLFTEDGNIKRYIGSEIIDKFEEGQMATTTYPNGYGHGPRTHDESIALNTVDKPVVKQNLRIRKLTPLECWRLMGADDMYFYRLRDIGGLTDAQIYHIAGDGLIVNIPQMLFETMKGE